MGRRRRLGTLTRTWVQECKEPIVDEQREMDALIRQVVGAVYEVSNTLGAGFLEKVYERALLIELRSRGLRAEAQVAIPVVYKGESVGDFFADILVEGRLIVELKCADALCDEHLAQCINYLKATGRTIAL